MRTRMLPAMLVLVPLLGMVADHALAQPAGYNYDEEKVPEFELPDPLVTQDGTPVKDARTWESKRRPEILELFREHVYGRRRDVPSR